MTAADHGDATLTHAGGIAYRTRGEEVEILLVRARPAPHDWVLPKGHIEPGESPPDCARREIREEAGVDADPVALLGHDRFTTPQGKAVVAAFYLMRFVGDVPAGEQRERGWFSFPEALAAVRFEGARALIRAARGLLAAQHRGG